MADNITPWQKDWKDHKEIDRGGQGIITELHHKTDSSRRGILKRIVERWRNDPQAHERLKQEVETLSKLHALGAHVPEVYDSFLSHTEAEPFLLMEFIEGIRFDNWLKASAPVKAPKAVLVTQGIVETIKLCHKHKIGHRDIKPSNIILRNGEIGSPYILDFGISFDSKQTMILTRDGEMFWNEFIILPECQDLEGHHRDLRSDITALAGLFFACLTGKPPIVLRDAQEFAPHKRHEKLLLNSAETVDQGERLIWFFDHAFEYRIDKRFQTLEEFTTDLQRLAESSSVENLDFDEQFAILDQTVRAKDRNVQLAALRQKWEQAFQKVLQQMPKTLKALEQYNGQLRTSQMDLGRMSDINKPQVAGGNPVNNYAFVFAIARHHFQHVAVALLAPYAVGMQIHLYSASYCAHESNYIDPNQSLTWSKIAVIDENTNDLPETKLSVIIEAIKSKLAHEIRNLREIKG